MVGQVNHIVEEELPGHLGRHKLLMKKCFSSFNILIDCLDFSFPELGPLLHFVQIFLSFQHMLFFVLQLNCLLNLVFFIVFIQSLDVIDFPDFARHFRIVLDVVQILGMILAESGAAAPELLDGHDVIGGDTMLFHILRGILELAQVSVISGTLFQNFVFNRLLSLYLFQLFQHFASLGVP
jgi:hypothetical protein